MPAPPCGGTRQRRNRLSFSHALRSNFLRSVQHGKTPFRNLAMNISRIADRFIVISESTHVPVYDFDFDLNFTCTHPQTFKKEELCILRIGAIPDYQREFLAKANLGLGLINSPSEHACASELEVWYPRLADLTPRTRVFAQLPPVEEIEATFTWPVFIKGSRQTSQHNPDLSIASDATQYRQIAHAYLSDPILHWQKPVVREFVPLRRFFMPTRQFLPGYSHSRLTALQCFVATNMGGTQQLRNHRISGEISKQNAP